MIATLTTAGAVHIAKHMRASDAAEVLAVTAVGNLEQWARAISSMPGVAMMAVADQEPVAMAGGIICGHIAGLWFVATDRIDEPAVRVDTHLMALRLHRDLAARGVRRCQVMPAADNHNIARWLDRLGYGLEGTHPGHGKNGETFTTWGKILEAPHAN